MDLWSIENELYDSGLNGYICGVDEAGRGPLAGPVCAAAVILPRNIEIVGLNDSKKLSAKKRDILFDEIIEKAVAYGVAFVDQQEIDRMNILNATFSAMNKAIAQLEPVPSIALVDGNTVRGIKYSARSIIGGDGKSASIAAASILAKVSRDRFMLQMAERYPEYGFEKHKGYGTKAHYAALAEYGPCPIHRITFLKKMH